MRSRGQQSNAFTFVSLIKEDQSSHNIGKCPGTPMFYTTSSTTQNASLWLCVKSVIDHKESSTRKVIHEKKLSTKSRLMSTVLLINIDISSLSLIFSTDSQEPSHKTLNGLLFDMKISLVLLNEFMYLSGPVKKFSYHYILSPRGRLSYGGFDYIKLCHYKQIVTDFNLTKKQEEYFGDHELRSRVKADSHVSSIRILPKRK